MKRYFKRKKNEIKIIKIFRIWMRREKFNAHTWEIMYERRIYLKNEFNRRNSEKLRLINFKQVHEKNEFVKTSHVKSSDVIS